jgi:hypothetical protein
MSLGHCVGLGNSPDAMAMENRDEHMVHISPPFTKHPWDGTWAISVGVFSGSVILVYAFSTAAVFRVKHIGDI